MKYQCCGYIKNDISNTFNRCHHLIDNCNGYCKKHIDLENNLKNSEKNIFAILGKYKNSLLIPTKIKITIELFKFMDENDSPMQCDIMFCKTIISKINEYLLINYVLSSSELVEILNKVKKKCIKIIK